MKKLWLPLTSLILSMLPAVLLFAHPGDRTTDKKSTNPRGQKIELARKGPTTGTKTTVKSTPGKLAVPADKIGTTRRIPDGDPDRPGKVLESTGKKGTVKGTGTGGKKY